MLVSPSVSVSSRAFRRSSQHGGHLGIPEVWCLPCVVCKTTANRSRGLGIQKGHDLVKDFLSDRSDAIGVNQSDGLAEVAGLHGLNDQVGLDRLVGLGGIASRESPPSDGIPVVLFSRIKRLKISEIEFVAPSVQVLDKACLRRGWVLTRNATALWW